MNLLDWTIVAAFSVFILLVGLLFTKKGSQDTTAYFVAGRKLPWWLAGLSLVATNFGSDTPMHMSAMTRRSGILGCWFYFRYIFTQIISGVLFAKLWRRSRVITDVEFFELRHGGAGAKVLRASMGVYYGLVNAPLFVCLFIRGMQYVTAPLLGFDDSSTATLPILGTVDAPLAISIALVVIALAYTATSGLLGVAWTDVIEFSIAMIAIYALMFIGVKEVGGYAGLRAGVQNYFNMKGAEFKPMAMLPGFRDLFSFTMLFYLLGNWWLADEITGKGQTAQRALCCRSEKDASLCFIANSIITFTFRSWPWFVTGFVSLLIFPNLADHEMAYPMMIKKLLPHGLLGLMFVSFLYAFLSSIDSFFNLGASYFVNDVYRPFIVKGRNEKHYLFVSRLATVGVACMGVFFATQTEGILATLQLVMTLGAGYGLIRCLRWFWWRINSWTELATVMGGFVWTVIFKIMKDHQVITPAQWIIDTFQLRTGNFPAADLYFSVEFMLICLLTLLGAAIVMFTTPADNREVMKEFYRKIRPAGPGWKPIAAACPEVKITDSLGKDILGFLVGTVSAFAAVFGSGYLLLGFWKSAATMGLVCVVFWFLLNNLALKHMDSKGEDD